LKYGMALYTHILDQYFRVMDIKSVQSKLLMFASLVRDLVDLTTAYAEKLRILLESVDGEMEHALRHLMESKYPAAWDIVERVRELKSPGLAWGKSRSV
jgi:hypothetical protein